MTKRVPATNAFPHQDSGVEGATLEETSLATHSTPLNVVTSEPTPSESGTVSAVPASCERDIAESQHNPTTQPTAIIASTHATRYRSAAVQTLPPSNAEQFHRIYDREPTNQELVSKTGSAAIGRYEPGLLANGYDVVLCTKFSVPVAPTKRANYTNSSFQTDAVAQCKKALLRAKAKASMLVNRQRDAAQSAGFRVWSETRDEHIIHSEQFRVSVQFDDEGNATNADVDGLSLPNIYGEEIDPLPKTIEPLEQSHSEFSYQDADINESTKHYTSSATSAITPPPILPSVLLHNTVESVSIPQRIRTVEPCVPSGKSDPVSIEYHGYFQLVPRVIAGKDDNGYGGKDREQQKTIDLDVGPHAATRVQKDKPGKMARKEETVMVLGGPRFADKYIIFDAVASTLTNPTTTPNTRPTTTKKRKSDDEPEEQVAISSPKRFKILNKSANALEIGTDAQEDRFVKDENDSVMRDNAKATDIERTKHKEDSRQAEGQQAQASTLHKMCNDEPEAEDERSPRSSPAHQDFRRRSRSPVGRHTSSRYRSKSTARRGSERTYEEKRRLHKVASEIGNDSRIHGGIHPAYTDKQGRSREDGANDVQKKDADEIVSVRKMEPHRRLEREQRVEEEKLTKRHNPEEAEIQRAREAKNRRNSEMEEKKQAQEADRQHRQEEKDGDRRRRRGDIQDRSRKESRQTVKQEVELFEPVDAYALERKAEARRRELVFTARGTGEADSRAPEQPPAGNDSFGRLEVERAKPEKKVETSRVTKPRPSRPVRGELERYDPRKKFGGGK